MSMGRGLKVDNTLFRCIGVASRSNGQLTSQHPHQLVGRLVVGQLVDRLAGRLASAKFLV